MVERDPAARDALAKVIVAAVDQITEFPEAAPLATNCSVPGTRRILLAKVRYSLYFRVSDDGVAVEVMSLWHASRGDSGL